MSLTVKPQALFVAARFDRDGQRHIPAVGELDRVVDQVRKDLTQAHRIANHVIGHPSGNIGRELKTFLVGPERERFEQVPDAISETETDIFQLHLAGFDLGKIQDIVDQPKERMSGGFRHVEILPLGAIETRFEDQVRHADDAVHRGANLVAHVRDEFALGPAGCFGRILRSA
ncbi:MAG TPA: hypothetical protein VJU77_15550 [Chthoniobacterales bacterium]|nr:hypothetical protein [Chthoniobacterales bacterium]